MFKLILSLLILNGLIQLGYPEDTNQDSLCEDSNCANRAPLNYAFVVLLYNSRNPNATCPGSIITHWWVLDNCEDFPGYEYEYFLTGWSTSHTTAYKICEVVAHKHYKRADLKSDKVDAEPLFSTKNALFLRSSTKKIQMIPEIIRTTKVNVKALLPKKGVVLYMNNGTIVKQLLPFLKNSDCDKKFKSYFDPGKQILLDNNYICVNTNQIPYDRCCNSQALLVADGILVGIMAWSTQCSKEFGVDPWVFTNIGRYAEWIFDNTDVKSLNKDSLP